MKTKRLQSENKYKQISQDSLRATEAIRSYILLTSKLVLARGKKAEIRRFEQECEPTWEDEEATVYESQPTLGRDSNGLNPVERLTLRSTWNTS